MNAILSILGFGFHLFLILPWFIKIAVAILVLFLISRGGKAIQNEAGERRQVRYDNKVKPRVEAQDKKRRFDQVLAAHEEVASRWNKKIKRAKDPAKIAELEYYRDKELRVTGHLIRSQRISPATGRPTKGIRREGKH